MLEATIQPQVAVLQDGARRHYAVPRALHAMGMLSCMYTDFFYHKSGRGITQYILGRLPAAASRCHPGIPGQRVVTFPWRGAWSRVVQRLSRGRVSEVDHLSRAALLAMQAHPPGGASAFYAYLPCCTPRVLRWARDAGLTVIGDQIMAPRRTGANLIRQHAQRWPGWWSPREDAAARRMADLEEALWPWCDRVIGGSGFVRRTLIDAGVKDEKITIIPHPLELEQRSAVDRSRRAGQPGKGQVVIGFVGQVGLRKGVPYLLEAALRLPRERYRVVVVGPMTVSMAALDHYRDRVEFTGRVPAAGVGEALAGFDVFALPSLCEGSANVINEAMASGLPVVCTAESGSRVRDGVEGFIVPAGDESALVEKLLALGEDADLRLKMGAAARQRVEKYSMSDYGQALAESVIAAVSIFSGTPNLLQNPHE